MTAAAAAPEGARRVVLALGAAQTLAWASSYYLPAILAGPMAREFGIGASWVFGAFSAALVLSAVLGPAVGRVIDRRGGRDVLAASNLVFAAGLYGRGARGPITGITLIAGFASTVGWPASALMEEAFGWRGACLAWAGLHLALGLPLNRLLVPPAPPPEKARAEDGEAAPAPRLAMPLLAFVFAATWFVTGAMAAHLPRMLELAGASAAVAVAAAALVGPAQVAARMLEFGLLRRFHPMLSARLATLGHPLGAAVLVFAGPLAAPAFTVLHGMGNGVLTIVKGTLPLAIFGPVGYGARQGLLSAPSRFLQALAPFLFGLLLERASVGAALALTSGLTAAAFLALMALRVPLRPSAGASTGRGA